MRRKRVGVLALMGALGALGAGCAGPLVPEAGGWRHPKQAWTIGRPDGPGAPWTRVEVEGALLAFERPDREWIAMQSSCGRPVASADVMARHLLIGIRDRELVASRPIEVDGRSGWQQIFEVRRGEPGVRVETVTLVAGRCTLDWILAGPAGEGSSEAAFEAWWQSFRLDPSRWAEPSG
jgi:hypothetical protein